MRNCSDMQGIIDAIDRHSNLEPIEIKIYCNGEQISTASGFADYSNTKVIQEYLCTLRKRWSHKKGVGESNIDFSF